MVGWAEPDTPLVRLALSPPEAPSLLRSPSVLRILNPHPPSPPDSSPHSLVSLLKILCIHPPASLIYLPFFHSSFLSQICTGKYKNV